MGCCGVIGAILPRLLPWAWPAAAIAAALLVAALGVQTQRLAHRDTELAEVKRAWSDSIAKANAAALAETARILAEQKKDDDEQALRTAALVRDSDNSRRALDLLRKRIAAITLSSPADPAPAGERTPVEAVGDALGSCAAAHQQLAATADADRSAGLRCEAAFDALTPPGYALPTTRLGGP